jgi:hypothetical protein
MTIPDQSDRPAGVTAVAALYFAAAVGCGVTVACTALGLWPLAWGRYVVGDLVTLGPVMFVIAALLYAVVALGLLWLKNWARRSAIVIAAIGLYFLVPTISNSVADLRIGAIALNGA